MILKRILPAEDSVERREREGAAERKRCAPPAACPFAEGATFADNRGARRALCSRNGPRLEHGPKRSPPHTRSGGCSPQMSTRPRSPRRRTRAGPAALSRRPPRSAPLRGEKGRCRRRGAARGPRYLHPLRLGAALGRPHLQAGGDALLQQGPGPRRPRRRHGEPAALRAGPGHAFPAPAPARGSRAAGSVSGTLCGWINGGL